MSIVDGNGQALGYNIDIVMCIDVTGSMRTIGTVRANALTLHSQIVTLANERETCISQLRVKVIAFRDYAVDSEPMLESKFFVLDEEKEEFLDFVSAIEHYGGGDTPENALEAMTLAFKSDWLRTGAIRRHVTIVFTDAPAKPLGTIDLAVCESYPEDMPKNMEELYAIWDDEEIMEKRAKRLIIFAPECEPWTEIGDWEGGVIHTPSMAGAGCGDIDMDDVLRLLFNSL